jgi:hypothetical protein
MLRFFSIDSDAEEFFGSAATSSPGTNGVSGPGPLVGFWVEDNAACSEDAELKITQFFVNQECKLDFTIDSTLKIEKRYSEKFISELTASSQISSLTLNHENKSGEIAWLMNIDEPRKTDTLSIIIGRDSMLEIGYELLASADSSFVKGDTITFIGLQASTDTLAKANYSYVGDEYVGDTLKLDWNYSVSQQCACIIAVPSTESYEIVYEKKTNGSVSYQTLEDNIFYYSGALMSDSYRGSLDIIDLSGRSIAVDDFRNGKIHLKRGIYILVTDNKKIQKLIVNSF